MLDFGWAELLIIVAVAVFVIGPKDIPNVMYGVGRFVRRFQYIKYAMSKQFDDMMQTHDIDELRKGVNFEDRSSRQIEAEIENDAARDIDQTQAHYTQIAKQYNETFIAPSEHMDEFLKYISPQAKILDAGCGTGNNTGYLYDKGFNVTAIDFSEEMRALAKENNPSLDFQDMDMRDLKFADASFDALISAYSIIHLKKSELVSVLEGFHRILNDDGYLYLAFHNGSSNERMEIEPFNEELKFFLNIIEENEMKKLLDLVGFKIIKTLEDKSSFGEELPYNKLTIIAHKTAQKEGSHD